MNSFLKYFFRGFFVLVISFCICAATQKKYFRDPFFLLEKTKRKKQQSSQSQQLLGVVRCDNRMGAIISNGKKQKTVFIGEKVGGRLVQNITMSEVVLKKGATLTRLTINE